MEMPLEAERRRWRVKGVTVTLYLDVFFLVNFGMDYLLLSLVKQFLRLRASPVHLSGGAFAGAVWACADLLLLSLPGWAELLLTWVVTGGVMVWIAFGEGDNNRNVRRIGVCLMAFWMASAMAGGIFGLLGDQTPVGFYLSGTSAVRQWRLLPFCFWAAGMYFGLRGCMKIVQKREKEQKSLYQVKLSYQGKEMVVTALKDTGNQLYEPYGGQPVHVISGEACKRLCGKITRLIYIPFRTVGMEYGMMPGIRIDSMEVTREGKVVDRFDHPWLAISKRPLSLGRQYEMLLHGESR